MVNITSCPESAPTTPRTSARTVIYEGRSANVTYGLEIAKEFFEGPIQFRSHRNFVVLHNYKAGREVRIEKGRKGGG